MTRKHAATSERLTSSGSSFSHCSRVMPAYRSSSRERELPAVSSRSYLAEARVESLELGALELATVNPRGERPGVGGAVDEAAGAGHHLQVLQARHPEVAGHAAAEAAEDAERAETLLQKVKTVYQLSDEDIPKIDPVTEQPKPGK